MPTFCKIVFFWLVISPVITFSQKDTLLTLVNDFILFETNKYEITKEAKEKLLKLLDTLPNVNGKHYVIEAHTDSRGSQDFNLELSQKRASAVQEFLEGNGIKTDRIKIAAYGKSKPKYTNQTNQGMMLNRRVDISIAKYFRITSLKGNISSDTTDTESMITILAFNKLFRDSTQVKIGADFEVKVIENQTLTLEAIGENYFFHSRQIDMKKINPLESIQVKLQSIKIDRIFDLGEINFYGNQANILPRSQHLVEALVKTMQFNPDVCFEIAGHVNMPGKTIFSGFEMDLSQRRAETIYKILVERMISAKRMTYKGYSNLHMKYPEPKNEAQAMQNRRVEIIIKDCSEISRLKQ